MRKFWEIKRNGTLKDLAKLTKENSIMDQKIFSLSSKIKEFEEQNIRMIENKYKLVKLYELEIINSAGDYISFTQDERENMC